MSISFPLNINILASKNIIKDNNDKIIETIRQAINFEFEMHFHLGKLVCNIHLDPDSLANEVNPNIKPGCENRIISPKYITLISDLMPSMIITNTIKNVLSIIEVKNEYSFNICTISLDIINLFLGLNLKKIQQTYSEDLRNKINGEDITEEN